MISRASALRKPAKPVKSVAKTKAAAKPVKKVVAKAPAKTSISKTSVSKTSLNKTSLNKTSVSKTSARKTAAKATTKPGALPEWNLADLYSGIDAPEIAHDLQAMDAACVAFETDFKGKLAEHTAREDGGEWLAGAVKRYEVIDDLAGRLGSYAGLVHAATASIRQSRNSMATSPSA
jgi:oligoendopeptidase F